MKSIRCGRGFGDSIYLQSVVRHLLEQGGLRMKVRSDWPDVFRPLGDRVEVAPFARQQIDILAHYSMRKGVVGTTQFQDCCISAGIKGPVDLRLDWTVTNQGLADKLRKPGKPILVVQLPRTPMGRTDGFGADLLPNGDAIQKKLDEMREGRLVVQIGAGQPLFHLHGIDVDLANKTTVAETIDVASVADGFLGYVSFLVPLAESFNKPALFVWSKRGLKNGHPFIGRITPQKVLHRPSSTFVIDEEVLR